MKHSSFDLNCVLKSSPFDSQVKKGLTSYLIQLGILQLNCRRYSTRDRVHESFVYIYFTFRSRVPRVKVNIL